MLAELFETFTFSDAGHLSVTSATAEQRWQNFTLAGCEEKARSRQRTVEKLCMDESLFKKLF